MIKLLKDRLPTSRRCRAVALFCGLAGLAALPVEAASLTVGPGQKYATIAAAVAAAHDGDTIDVMAGTYVNDFAEIASRVTLRAMGGQVALVATRNIPNGKGILITDTDVSIQGFSFSGARVSNADGANGAGLRYQGGNLSIIDCYFVNNQDGLLSNPDPNGTITIRNSEFAANGAASGPSAGYTHNLYVGAIASLDIENSYFHDAHVGHEIKSRALRTTINNTRIVDGPTGTASYSIDLPNGGIALISNDQIEQGPRSQNPIIISYGEEGNVPAGSSLTLYRSLVENDLPSPSALAVRNATSVAPQVVASRFYGLSAAQLSSLPVMLSANVMLTAEPPIATGHPW